MCVDRKDMERKGDFEEKGQAKFELRLMKALEHRAAPVGMKQRVLAMARERRLARHGRMWMWQRFAMVCVLIAVVGGFAAYHHAEKQAEMRAEERQRGEAARAQVMLAFKITQKTLDRVGERVANGR
jgi:hypothetical protein